MSDLSHVFSFRSQTVPELRKATNFFKFYINNVTLLGSMQS